ncbi:MAG TPA: hypothetical protein ENK85_09720, partial [Saprospiraceae bacterium]|nr:hypothetical protein [Saprospiraceae bacterium]
MLYVKETNRLILIGFFVYLSMKKGTQTRLFIGLLLLMVSMNSFGQNCKDDGLRRKYRLYKERFYRHFIVNDRSNTGCVHDGIGLVLSKDSIQCQFQKQGYGLPATNLWISPNGAGIPGNELNNRMNVDCRNFGISWIGEDDDPKANKKHRFNWLDFGSETLSELGWWLVTLGTEYELKRREGDVKGQQKALEDIFLSLQALRRLDMQAQHLLDRTYAKRS